MRFLSCVAPALAVSVTACGGAVAPPAGSPPAEDAGSAPITPAASCSTLSVAGPVHAVSDVAGATTILASMSAGSGGALVAWRSNDALPLSAPVPLRVREVGFDGAPLGSGHDALTTLGAGGSLAGGPAGAAIIADDEATSCRFVPLAADGSPSGAVVSTPASLCGALRATASGFDWIDGDSTTGGLSLVAWNASASGGALPTVPLTATPTDLPAAIARATFSDGSFLLALTPQLLSNCVCATPISVRHFSATGVPLAAAVQVGRVFPGQRFALVADADGGGALLLASGTAFGSIMAQPLDRDGQPSAAGFALGSTGSGVSVLGLDAAPAGAGLVLVAWIEEDTATSQSARVVAQVVGASGPASGSVVASASAPGPVGRDVRIVATPAGALVAWDGSSSQAAPVSAVALSCAP